MVPNDNVVSLREYVDRRFSDQQKAVNLALENAKEATAIAMSASEKANDKEENNVKRWQEAANEWRGAMSDRERDFLTRKEFYSMIAAADAVFALVQGLA